MRAIAFVVLLTIISSSWSFGGQVQLTNVVKASLEFREETKESAFYPHLLLIYLHLENLYDSDVDWVCNSVNDIDVELFDAKGNLVAHPPLSASITSNEQSYMIPYHSQLDWMIAHQGISMIGDLNNSYALMIGGKGWLIPVASIASYSLKVRVRRMITAGEQEKSVLFDVPRTAIVIKQVKKMR